MTTAMSPPAALTIPEIVAHILDFFRVYSYGDLVWPVHPFSDDTRRSSEGKRRTLCNVALTNTMMRDCALPVLWSSLDDIAPLLKLIPTLEYQWETDEWRLRRNLREEDLVRFDLIAPFVKKLAFISAPGQILSEIYEFKGRVPLLPSLASLSVIPRCRDYIEAFLHDRVQNLHIQRDASSLLPRDSLQSWPILPLLQKSSPLLETLWLNLSSPSDFGIDLLDITPWANLRVVSLPSLNFNMLSMPTISDLLEHLSTLPKLQALSIGLLHELSGSSMAPKSLHASLSGRIYPFLTLKNLCLHTSNPIARAVLPAIRAPSIMNLDLVPSEGGWVMPCPGDSDILSTIARTQYRNISTLRVQYWTVLEAAWLKPLLQIPGLRCMDMDLSKCSSLTDDLIDRMASSWPQLEHFRLYSSRGDVNLPIHCIQAFARHCPNLLSLSLDLKAGDIPSPMATKGLVPLGKVVIFSVSSWSKIHGDQEVDFIEQHLRVVLPSLQLAYVERRDAYDFGIEQKEDWDFAFDRIHQDLDPVLQEQWTQFQPSFSEWRDSPVGKLTLTEYRKQQEETTAAWAAGSERMDSNAGEWDI